MQFYYAVMYVWFRKFSTEMGDRVRVQFLVPDI